MQPDGQCLPGFTTGIDGALDCIPCTAVCPDLMKGLTLPPRPGKLVIAPDGDAAGREAANALARTASGLGWSVSLMTPPDGQDWNDVLQSGVAA